MKVWIRKMLCLSMAMIVVCSMLVAIPVQADEDEDPVLEVTGGPKGLVHRGDKFTITITASNIASLGDANIQVDGSFESEDYNEEKGAIVKEIEEGTPVSISITIPDSATGECSWCIDLYDGEDYITFSDYIEYSIQENISASLQWTKLKEAVAGTPYPFTISVKNISDKILDGIRVNAYASNHVIEGWHADVVYKINGKEIPDGIIRDLEPGAEMKLDGTITFPANAVGDSTLLLVDIYDDVNSDNATIYLEGGGSENRTFPIVAVSSNQPGTAGNGNQGSAALNGDGQNSNGQIVKPQITTKDSAVETGDTASIAVTLTAMLIAFTSIVMVWKKRQTV